MRNKKIADLFEKLQIIIKRFAVVTEHFLQKLVPSNIKATLHNETFSKEGIERLVAVGLDIFISLILLLFPLWGWLISLAYFLTKDALPFFNGQSVGKHFFGLRVVHKGSLNSILKDYKTSALRGIIFLIPGLNLYDIYRYLTTGERLADEWAETTVIKDKYYIPS